jgi:hypothetical protein
VVVGTYLYGSTGLGDYQPGRSDIDFVTVVNRKLGERDMDALRRVHEELRRTHRGAHLNGTYLMGDQMGKSPGEIEPVPCYSDGRLSTGHFDLNPVTWFQLKETGIALSGPDLSTYHLSTDLAQVRDYVFGNINSYWRKWVERASRPFSALSVSLLLFRRQAEWGVLGVTRQYVTITGGRIVSKTEAGEYGLRRFPKWAKVINEALAARLGRSESQYTNPLSRRRDALDYMDMVIGEVNRHEHR